jgi:hypothetical protein
MAAVKRAASFHELPAGVLTAALELYEATTDEGVRAAIKEAGRQIQARQVCYRPQEVGRVRELSLLRATKESIRAVGPDGVLRLPLAVAANGANFVVVKPAVKP